MAKEKKPQPYIDYGKAIYLTRIYDFINRANRMREDVYTALDDMSFTLAIMQKTVRDMMQAFSPAKNPNARFHENDIEALKAYAWEAGLTNTLFEKLKDRDFRDRFTASYGHGDPARPVQKEEIEDRYADEESA